LVAVLSHFVYQKYPRNRFFIEQDPSLSYPVEKGWSNGEEIPLVLVVILAVPTAMVLLFLFQLLAKKLFQELNLKASELHPKALHPFTLQLAFIEALGMTLAATEFFKAFAGRKRPNFFALCNYKGYLEAITTNNFTAYLDATTAGTPGDIAYCLASEKDILEAQFSFPSGHASTIWCGMTFVAIYTLYIFHHYSPRNGMSKGILVLLFATTACLVSVTRTRDYWHNFDDILSGGLIGFASAVLAFALNYSPTVSTLYRKDMVFPPESNPLLTASADNRGPYSLTDETPRSTA